MKFSLRNTKTVIAFSLGCFTLILMLKQVAHTAQHFTIQQSAQLTIAPSSVQVKDSVTLSVKLGESSIAAGSSDTGKLSLAASNDLLDFDPSTLTLKLKPGKYLIADDIRKIKLKYSDENNTIASNEITATIKPNILPPTVKLEGQNNSLPPRSPIYLTEGQAKRVIPEVKLLDGTPVDKPLTWASSDPNVIRIDGQTLKCETGLDGRNTQIKLKVDGSELRNFSIEARVLARPSAIDILDLSSQQLDEGQARDFRVVLRKQGTVLPIVTDYREIEAKQTQPTTKPMVEVSTRGDVVTVKALILDKDIPGGDQQVEITIQVKQDGLSSDIKQPLTLYVRKRAGYITFSPPIVEPLLPNGKVTTTAQVRDLNGTPQGTGIRFDIETSDEKWVTLAQEGYQLTVHWRDPAPSEIESKDGNGNTIRLARPAQVVVKATAYLPSSNQAITGKVQIRMAAVTKFAPLKVKLNVMDDEMASSLYGKVTSNENYVLTVRLFNNLKEDENKQYIGSSILAYSASVEIAVGLEKRFNPKLKSELAVVWDKNQAQDQAKKRKDKVYEIAKSQQDKDLSRLDNYQKQINEAIAKLRDFEAEAASAEREALDLRYRQQTDLSKNLEKDIQQAEDKAVKLRQLTNQAMDQFNSIRTEILRTGDARSMLYQVLAEMSDPGLPVDDGKWRIVRRDDFYRIADSLQTAPSITRPVKINIRDNNEPVCTGAITYRPYTFEMMVNTVDRRDERSVRAKVFKVLSGFGTAASLATTIPGFRESVGSMGGTSNELASFQIFLDKYTNLLLPAADRLFPNLKETHRQNIVSQSMKAIEEIPFGSDITRVLFIPKKEIRGLLRGHDLRISEICPYYFSIEVAIIQKGGSVQQGAVTP